MVELVPEPVVVVPPGDLVKVHVPVAGSPLKITLPVAKAQVGCVIVPTVGVAGVQGLTVMITWSTGESIVPSFTINEKV